MTERNYAQVLEALNELHRFIRSTVAAELRAEADQVDPETRDNVCAVLRAVARNVEQDGYNS